MKTIAYFILAGALLSGCGSASDPEAPATASVAIDPENSNTVTLDTDQMTRAGIEIGEVGQHPIAATLNANGKVVVLPEDKATVSSRIGGRIEAFFVHEGQNVRKGQALLSIGSSAILDLQQDYLRAKADLIFLEKELERQKTLSGEQVGPSKNFESAQAQYFRTRADLHTAAAKLEYFGIDLKTLEHPDRLSLTQTVVVRAPISGNVTDIPVNLGASVGEGNTLCNIVNLDRLHAHIEVFARDIHLVREGQEISIRLSNTSAGAITTRIEHISRDLDPDTRTYSLHAMLPVPKGAHWLPGMPLTAGIKTQGAASQWALPESAVLHNGSESYCYVVAGTADQRVEFRKLSFEPTLSGGGLVGIPEGLPGGRKVVLKGAHLVDGEMRKGEMQE